MSPGARVLVYNVITSRVESNTSGGAEFKTHKEGFQLSLPVPKRPNSANFIHAKPRKRSTLLWFGFSKQRTDHWGNQKIPSWSPAEMVGELRMAQVLTLYHYVLKRKHPLVCRGKRFFGALVFPKTWNQICKIGLGTHPDSAGLHHIKSAWVPETLGAAKRPGASPGYCDFQQVSEPWPWQKTTWCLEKR